MKKIIFVMIIMAAAGAVVWNRLTTAQTSAEERPIIKIGATLPLSGDSGHIGTVNRKAMEMVLERLKNKGLKYNYELITEDNQASPKLTATTASKLTVTDKVKAVFTIWHPMGGIVSDITSKNEIFSFSCSYGGAEGNRGELSFNAISSPEDIADLTVKTLQKKGIKSVAVFIDNGSEVIVDKLLNKLKNSDIKLLAYEVFNIGETDFKMAIRKAAMQKPDIYLTSGYPPLPYLLMKQIREITGGNNITGIDSFTDMPTKQRAEAEGLWFIDSNVNGTLDFAEELRKSKEVEPESCAGNTASNLEIFIDAVENAKLEKGENMPNNQNILAYLRTHTKNKKTSSGVVNLIDNGIIDVKPVVKIVKNGQPIPLETE